MNTPELFDLRGRLALVTGGGRGIGRHLVAGLAEAGADVVVTGRHADALRESAARVEAAGRRAWPIAADVADPAAVDALLAEVEREAGVVDVLVNNAGRVWAARTLEYPLEGWDRVFDLNVRGLFYLSQQVARGLVAAGRPGSIVHVSSISAFRGAPDEEQPVIAYNASKGAVVALTIDMAVKLAPHGIRVNNIAPGPFLTDMMNHIRHEPEKLARYESGIPLGRSGGEDDIKGAVVFLASEAARFVTGQTLVVDGGVTTLARA